MFWPTLHLLQSAAAAPCETPFDETALRGRVEEAWAAIEAEDPAAHLRVKEALEAELPCLDDQLPSRPWADFLITDALVRNVAGDKAWPQPLSLALSIVPDHPLVPTWLMEQYEPATAPPETPVIVPAGRLIFLDGRLVTNSLPALIGPHVAQTFTEDTWSTVLVRDGSLPAAWLEQPEPDRPEVTPGLSSWGAIGLAGGLGRVGQVPAESGAAFIQERALSGTAFGLSTHGQQNFSRSLGVFFLADGFFQNQPHGTAYLGLSLFNEPLSLWLGAGLTTTSVLDERGESTLILPGYHVGVSYRSGTGLPLDVHVGGGWWLNGAQAQGRVGVSPFAMGPVRLRVGAQASYASFTLINVNNPASGVLGRAYRWSGGLTLGISWGTRKSKP